LAIALAELAVWLDPAALLSIPVVAFGLRVALGSYVLYMARGFYADPFAYFRKWMPDMPEYLWMGQLIRGAACFCVWGGCFIVATAIATQILGLYGWPVAFALIALGAIGTYFLLPRKVWPELPDASEDDPLDRIR
jgi:hypothetical protein